MTAPQSERLSLIELPEAVDRIRARRVNLVWLELEENLDFDEWEEAGRQLGRLARGTQFWIGDWILYGEERYGEEYAQALEATGLAEKTLMNYVWVAQNVQPEIRRSDLSWQHHLLVAGLASAHEQAQWLEHAYAGMWSTRELRAELQKDGLVRSYKPRGSYEEEELCGQCGRMVKARCE